MLHIPEGRDVVLDFVDVILGDALVFRLALLLGHVAPDQVAHYGLRTDKDVIDTTLPYILLLLLAQRARFFVF